jgi:hypothetical protein
MDHRGGHRTVDHRGELISHRHEEWSTEERYTYQPESEEDSRHRGLHVAGLQWFEISGPGEIIFYVRGEDEAKRHAERLNTALEVGLIRGIRAIEQEIDKIREGNKKAYGVGGPK